LARLAPAIAGLATLGLSASAAVADPHGEHHGGGHEHGGGYQHGGGYDRGPAGPGGFGRRGGPGGPGGGYPRGPSEGPHNWDQRRYNGYYLGPRWYPGEPPSFVFGDPNYRPGFTPWRRGEFLPEQYQGFVVGDYGRYHLRRPPYGYVWVQAGDE